MEVCGTHTMAIARAGIKKLLPDSVRLISGPGCPVCVTDQEDIDRAITVARQKDVIMTTFGDMMRVPGSRASFQEAKAQGADVRVVYSCMDALALARKRPDRKVVFMGVGFETTSPTIAATVWDARQQGIKNFFVLSNFKLIFPALDLIGRSRKLKIDGFICPGHVSVITGSRPYQAVVQSAKKPCVITGFEPADIFKGIELLLQQIDKKRHAVEIAYRRAVTTTGNKKARAMLDKIFEPCDARWRGLGMIPKSGLCFRKAYHAFDATRKFPVRLSKVKKAGGCRCGDIIQGVAAPQDCRLFAKRCTPRDPVGPCMVSSEGACAAAFKYEK